MDYFLYRGAKTTQISFPLGGIGSGSIGLAGNGRLLDWEIYNRPNKGSVNGFSHFAVKVEDASGKVQGLSCKDARILHGDLHTPYQGELGTAKFASFGWGPRREYMTGLPHFTEVEFRGEYPLAELSYHHERFPGQVKLRAFNPLIPLNDKDSSIPAAFFEYSMTNTTSEPLFYTVVGVLGNPLPENNLHTARAESWGHTLHLRSDSLDPQSPHYGDLTLSTDAGVRQGAEVSWQEYWFRGAWFDNLEVYWNDLNQPGGFKNRGYPADQAGDKNNGALAVRLPIAPGETKTFRFLISWNFPTYENYWKPKPPVVEDSDFRGERGAAAKTT